MRRAFLYQDHFVAIARKRLGREEADVMLVDAAHRRKATVARLSDALGIRLNMGRNEDGATEAEAYELREGTRWHGGSLHLDTRLPATLQQHIPGRPLGDVVAGSGADAWPVLWTCDTASGTTVAVDAKWIDARSIRLPMRTAAAGPARRARLGMAHAWRSESDRSRFRPPTWTDIVVQMLIGCLLLTPMTMSIAMALAWGGMPGVALTTPFILFTAWHVATVGAGIVADIRRWPRRGE